jgi:hypothetical protein
VDETSIGANINEVNYGVSKADFISKMQIALKETAETEYWLRLLMITESLDKKLGEFVDSDCGKKALNALRQRLGDVRKIEKGMDNRRYYHRQTENEVCLNDNAKQNLEKLIKDWRKSLKK